MAQESQELSLQTLLDELEKIKQQLKRAARSPAAAAAIVERQVSAVGSLQDRIKALAKEPPHAPPQPVSRRRRAQE